MCRRAPLRLTICLLALGAAASAGAVELTAGRTAIVVDARAPGATRFAASELKSFLSRSLGGDIPVVNAPPADKVAIVLGTNVWSEAAGLDVAAAARDTFVIAARGERVYIAGRDADIDLKRRIASATGRDQRVLARTERATAFGVYEFLERFAGCRFYFPGELGEIVPRADRIAVPDGFRLTKAPRWSQRSVSIDAGNASDQLLNWVRLRLETGHIQCGHGLNSFGYARRFAATRPDYFCLGEDGRRFCPTKESGAKSHDVGQLCHTSAVWNEITEDALSYLRGETAERRLGKGPAWPKCCHGGYVDVMPQDGMKKCHCPKCLAAYDEGRDYADTLIWDNTCRLAERVLAEGLDGRIAQMAYHPYKRVPARTIPPNVDVMVATCGPWSMRDAADFARDERLVKAWTEKLGRPVWLWTYPGKYNRMNVPDAPIATPRAWGRYFTRLAPHLFGAFNESLCESHAFNYLNHYVFARLAWEAADADALVDEHHRLMYGKGAAAMGELLDRLENLWLTGGLVEKSAETAGGEPTYDPAHEYDLLTRVYSRERLDELDGFLKTALAAVPDGSLFARRIRHTARTVYGPIRRRARAWQEACDPEAEILRRKKAVRVVSVGPSAPWKTSDPGWRAEADRVVWTITGDAGAEISFRALGVTLKPNTSYHVACHLTTELPDMTYFQCVKRNGGVNIEVAENGTKKDWAHRHFIRTIVGTRARACYGIDFTTGDEVKKGGRIVFSAKNITGRVTMDGLAICEVGGNPVK